MAQVKNAYILTNKDRAKPYQLMVQDYVIDDDGNIKKKLVSWGSYANKREAEKQKTAASRNYPRKLTFKFISDAYVIHKGIQGVALKDYRYGFKKLSDLHDREMVGITVNDLSNVVSKIDSFSPRKKARLIISQLYKYSIEQGILEDDLSTKFKLPEIKNKTNNYNEVFTEDDLDKITSDNYDDFTFDIAMFIMKSGIKLYTALDIKLSDIDINKKMINVGDNHAIKKTVVMSDEVMEIVRKYYDLDKEYLFTNHFGTQLEYSVFRKYNWNPFMNHYGMNYSPQVCYATYLKYGGEKMAQRRRANGHGGIAYRKGRANPYMAEISIITPDGVRRKCIGSFKTEKEAQRALDEYTMDTIKLDKSKYCMTFTDVYNEWIDYRKFVGKAKNPEKDYFASFNALKPLHDIKFRELTTYQINRAIQDSGKNAPTLRKVIIMLHQMYKFARSEKIVEHDESESITIGAHSELNRNPNQIHHQSFTSEEIKELLSDKDNKIMVDIFKFMIHTGVRTHEFLTLTKDAIDLENKTIHIKKEFSKTNYSERFIPIHPAIMDIVVDKYNKCTSDDEVLFKTDTGIPFQKWNFRNTYWKPFMELHDLSSHYPHDTRYTFSTFWDYCHLDTRDGEIILGHSSKSDITKLYKTPDMMHRYSQMCKLTFDIQSENDIQVLFEKEESDVKPVSFVSVEANDISRDDFLKAKEEMNRLGFTSFNEYNEYLEFVNSRKKNPPEM